MYHCKQMIIQDTGSRSAPADLEDRSFRLNDEANLHLMDQPFAGQQIRIGNDDLSKCRRISYQEWRQRPSKLKS